MKLHLSLLTLGFSLFGLNHTALADFEKDKAAIESMAGCYQVDYTYAETESIHPNYKLPAGTPVVYDARLNKNYQEFLSRHPEGHKLQAISKKLLFLRETDSPNEVHLQHIIFIKTNPHYDNQMPRGPVDFIIKHHSERWVYEPKAMVSYIGDNQWRLEDLENSKGKWSRTIMRLDDGPRYSCLTQWDHSHTYPQFTCNAYAPIPGREYRDMNRKDYHALERSALVTLFSGSFLERQANIKVKETQQNDSLVREALVQEEGKHWYIPMPKEECAFATTFSDRRQAFWSLTREFWDSIFQNNRIYREQDGANAANIWGSINGGPHIWVGFDFHHYQQGLESQYLAGQLRDSDVFSKLMELVD